MIDQGRQIGGEGVHTDDKRDIGWQLEQKQQGGRVHVTPLVGRVMFGDLIITNLRCHFHPTLHKPCCMAWIDSWFL